MCLTNVRHVSTLFDVIGLRLKIAREKAEVSTKELDRLAELRPGHTWAVENSKSGNADTKTLAKLAGVLGLSLDYLVCGEGSEPSELDVKAAVAATRARIAAALPPDTTG
jgi:transcriptional regulator with XRE-family HTH domain